MKLWPKRRTPETRYWINGYGPFDTIEERDKMHTMLRDLAEHNRRGREHVEKALRSDR